LDLSNVKAIEATSFRKKEAFLIQHRSHVMMITRARMASNVGQKSRIYGMPRATTSRSRRDLSQRFFFTQIHYVQPP